MQKILRPLHTVVMLVLGLCLLPIVIIFNFVSIKRFASSLFSGLDFISLNEESQRKRLAFKQLSTTPSLETHKAIRDEVKVLIEADSWLRLSDMILEWDQSRAKCEAGFPKASSAVSAVIHLVSRGAYEGHACHPDPIYDISDDVAEMLETKAATHSGSYPLLVLAALARCYQGWCARGEDYAEYVSEDGWFGMSARFAKAQWLLDRFDPTAMNAPILAAARYKLLAFMPDSDKHVYRYYEEWSALDPKDQAPHTAHGLMMLPRWFGGEGTLEVEAQKAAQRTANYTGDAAYFSIYARAFREWDPHVLLLDFNAFRQGAHDLTALRGRDPSFVAQLYQDMIFWAPESDRDRPTPRQKTRAEEIESQLKDLRNEILQTSLTAIHGRSWEGGVRGAIDEISALVQDHIKEGNATFALTDNGLVITLPETALQHAT